MSLPTSVVIFGKVYPVTEVTNLKACCEVCDGLYAEETIQIDSSLSEKAKKHTLWHEMGHALMERTGILQTGISDEVLEIIVENYATMITEFQNQTPGE